MQLAKSLSLVAISSSLFIAGCQSTSISVEEGKGAVVFPVTIDMGGAATNFACRTIVIDIKEKFRSGRDLDKALTRSLPVGSKPPYVIADNLPPGEYTVTEYRCLPNVNWTLGGKSYLRKNTYISFEIYPNKITISDFAYRGKEKFKSGGGSTFSTSFQYSTKEEEDRAIEALIANGIPKGLEIDE
ncbi:hypothetical protein [Enterovibrio coralii]|uniref:Lipoprotein n=1 Tax=Enterovibrio coralii TaxID=294935 RepID=A0A135I546_9GAMM|nr:hypothetical protein [Enterovibrio coralii]KXF80558.1 hypothetical protein ATN88_07705 [Enterovibrio coralii]